MSTLIQRKITWYPILYLILIAIWNLDLASFLSKGREKKRTFDLIINKCNQARHNPITEKLWPEAHLMVLKVCNNKTQELWNVIGEIQVEVSCDIWCSRINDDGEGVYPPSLLSDFSLIGSRGSSEPIVELSRTSCETIKSALFCRMWIGFYLCICVVMIFPCFHLKY